MTLGFTFICFVCQFQLQLNIIYASIQCSSAHKNKMIDGMLSSLPQERSTEVGFNFRLLFGAEGELLRA
ncbi:CLUMA_CG011675, isoform A [Clunio marinus]|uniref:CLUMA_CG011675, isoform A n=1 Tax=Clunio marinus TaxID=568069 RepID=A0A1J1IIN0_9DIPT|nr:CLUMA_CG011675, isoform A [Clunio marinus]